VSTADITGKASQVYRSARRSPWTKRWARFGFATGGIVYIIIGVLAAMVAFAGRGRIVGPEGALEHIARQPYGRALLFTVAIGLSGYAVWRFIQAISDTDRDGGGWKGTLSRIGVFCTGIGYSALAAFAFHRALSNSRVSGDAAQHWTGILLRYSWGPGIVGFVGLALAGAAIAEAIYAIREKYRDQLKTWELNREDLEWIVQCGKWGYLAQAVVLLLIGVFLVIAAIEVDWTTARGLDGALRTLARQEYGPYLLGVVALGLTAYGIFMLILARYRRLA
jgi:hypothetical protein